MQNKILSNDFVIVQLPFIRSTLHERIHSRYLEIIYLYLFFIRMIFEISIPRIAYFQILRLKIWLRRIKKFIVCHKKRDKESRGNVGRRYSLRLRRSTDRKPIISHDRQCSRGILNFAFYRRRIEFSRATMQTFYTCILYFRWSISWKWNFKLV